MTHQVTPGLGLQRWPLVSASLGKLFSPEGRAMMPGDLASVRFSGATHQLQGRHWLSAESFYAVLAKSATPYVGRVPSPLLKQVLPHSPKQIYQALDELAPVLRSLEAVHGDFMLGEDQLPVAFQYVGQGSYGTVYRLTIGEQAYALKIYHDSGPDSLQDVLGGSYRENSLGVYLSKKRFNTRRWRDISRFHFANPQAGWGVYEFVTKPVAPRPGRSIESLPGIVKDRHRGNYIGGLRIDYGGILAYAHKQAAKVSASFWRPDIATLSDFESVFQHPNPHMQRQAVLQLQWLPGRQQLSAFEQVMASGKEPLQQEAASLIHRLHRRNRLVAFEQAMQTQRLSVQLAAVSQLPKLPEPQSAYQNGFRSPHSEVRAATVRHLSHVYSSPSARLAAFSEAMEMNVPIVQAAAASQIEWIPSRAQMEAGQQILQTGYPPAQEALAERLFWLSKPNRYPLFLALLQTGHADVQRAAISQIRWLPRRLRGEALNQAMQEVQVPSLQAWAAAQIRWLPIALQDSALGQYMALTRETSGFELIRQLNISKFSRSFFDRFQDW